MNQGDEGQTENKIRELMSGEDAVGPYASNPVYS